MESLPEEFGNGLLEIPLPSKQRVKFTDVSTAKGLPVDPYPPVQFFKSPPPRLWVVQEDTNFFAEAPYWVRLGKKD